MEYEIVNITEKLLVGVGARTNNQSPNVTQIIGGLWQQLFGENLYLTMNQKKDDTTMCLYDHYEADWTGDYDVTIGCEVNTIEGNEAYIVKHIQAGRYAKFILKGDMNQVVPMFWNKLWQMKELKRSYKSDFEHYINNDVQNSEIHMYISIE